MKQLAVLTVEGRKQNARIIKFRFTIDGSSKNLGNGRITALPARISIQQQWRRH